MHVCPPTLTFRLFVCLFVFFNLSLLKCHLASVETEQRAGGGDSTALGIVRNKFVSDLATSLPSLKVCCHVETLARIRVRLISPEATITNQTQGDWWCHGRVVSPWWWSWTKTKSYLRGEEKQIQKANVQSEVWTDCCVSPLNHGTYFKGSGAGCHQAELHGKYRTSDVQSPSFNCLVQGLFTGFREANQFRAAYF